MLFDKYKNEEVFRNEFVRPLLTRLGFLSIAELDGSQEFGKDFVFSEITPFGFMRHYGVVVKHEKSIRQPNTKLCETVLSQIRQAFSVKFRLPESARESHVSAVLVMNSGTITPNAREWLRSEVSFERYGENVHIFDGERLLQLDHSATFNQQQTLIPKLHGLVSTINLNKIVWNSIENTLPSFSEARGCFTHSLEDYVSSPFLNEYISLNEVSLLLQECRIIDSINSRYLLGVPRSKEELKNREIETMRGLVSKAKQRSDKLLTSIHWCLANFRPVSKKQS
jgi:hypothetical protein